MSAAESPDWVGDTPEETTYDLSMYEPGGGSIQEIDITRTEYLALKRHLAGMRGYGVGDPAARLKQLVESGPEGYNSGSDEYQAAMHLETARDFYLHCPDLVVCVNAELDDLINATIDRSGIATDV